MALAWCQSRQLFFHFFAIRFTIARVSASEHKPIDKDRLVSAVQAEDDASYELKLRPRYLREFIGQKKVKENLAVAVEAAKSRGEALDHVLLYGPPGLGKTTLATIIANEMGVAYQQSAGPAIQIKGDLTAILTNLRDRQVCFWMKYTACSLRWKKSCIRRWKITSSTSSLARGPRPARTPLT